MNTNEVNSTTIAHKLKKTHEGFTVGIGITIGIIFMAYFFSFAAFIDNVRPALVTFQAITTVIFVFCLIYLKRVALYCTRLKYRNSEPHLSALLKLTHTDFDKDEKGLSEVLTMRQTEK